MNLRSRLVTSRCVSSSSLSSLTLSSRVVTNFFVCNCIQADMRNIAFYFRETTGFPKITDSGLADVVLGGQGLTTIVQLVSADKGKRCVPFPSRLSSLFTSIFYPNPPTHPYLHYQCHQRLHIICPSFFFNSSSSQDLSYNLRPFTLVCLYFLFQYLS